MTSSNLGIVFGPTLMRPRPTDATISLSSLVDYPHQARIIEALIIFYSTIFENKETTALADSSKYATGSKEAAGSCPDLVGVSGEGSTLGGCGAIQDSPCTLATWSRPGGADPPAALTPPSPLLTGAVLLLLCPADCTRDVPHPRCAARGDGSGQCCCLSLRNTTLLCHVPPPCIPTPLVSDLLPQKSSVCRWDRQGAGGWSPRALTRGQKDGVSPLSIFWNCVAANVSSSSSVPSPLHLFLPGHRRLPARTSFRQRPLPRAAFGEGEFGLRCRLVLR